MIDELLDRVFDHDELAKLAAPERRLALRELLVESGLEGDAGPIVRRLADEIDGHGPLTGVMADDSITDVLINGPGDIWVEAEGRLRPAGVRFESHSHLRRWIDRTLGSAGARVDQARPIADARMSNGARVHVVLPPVAPQGPLVSVRRFPREGLSLEALKKRAFVDDQQAALLEDLVGQRRSVVISGRTGSGKTTLLNALLGLVNEDERVVLVEETQELSPHRRNHVSLLARPANVEDRGGIDLDVLVRAALRMRPDRIVLGEVRGAEARAALGAMSTGHQGSMVTVHAASVPDALERMVDLALGHSSNVSEPSLRRQVSRAFQAGVHLGRAASDGRRRVEQLMLLE
jgi:pilus assembly protein CpaF